MSARPDRVVAFRDLDVDPDDELLDRFHRDVLTVSFSPDELDDVETMAPGLRGEGDTEVLCSVAVDSDGAVLGGVVGEVFVDEQVLLLSYLAVRPDLRGRGIGTALMSTLRRVGTRTPPSGCAVGEVHDPRMWSDVPGDDPLSRLRLYERLGARVLGVPFVQPALDDGLAPHPRLPAARVPHRLADRDHGRGRCAVPADLVGRFVRRYYEIAEDSPSPIRRRADTPPRADRGARHDRRAPDRRLRPGPAAGLAVYSASFTATCLTRVYSSIE